MLSVTQIQLPLNNFSFKAPAIKLKPNTPKKIKQALFQLSKPVPKYLNEKILASEDLPQILSHMLTWYSLEAFYSTKIQNSQTPLLKSIQQINFPRLTQLYLENVNMYSLEGVQWIDSPNLKAIYLMRNHLISIKALAKTRFNLLQIIQLDREVCRSQLFNLTRTKLSSRAKITTKDTTSANNKNRSDKLSSQLQEVIFKLESRPREIQQSLSVKINKQFEALVMEMNK